MMLRRLIIFLAFLGMMAPSPSYAVDAFTKNNPDVKKYEFVRSYISALSYMNDIFKRWNKNAPKKHFAGQKLIMIKAILNDLALDNSDLRVIKNYLIKYLGYPNLLMRKVADIIVVSTDSEIALNDQEKLLWDKWYGLMANKQASKTKEVEFVKNQYKLELRRKQLDKEIVRASVLVTKVLMSDQNKDGKGHLLAVTAKQRQKLLDKLDSYGSDTLDWGLKSGQTTIAGCIAAIREILEDPIWISIDER